MELVWLLSRLKSRVSAKRFMNKNKRFSLPTFLKKYGWVLLFIIMVVAVVTIYVMPEVSAATVNDQEWIDKWQNFLSGFGVTIFDKMAEGYKVLTEFASSKDYSEASGVQSLVTGIAHVFVVLFMIIGIIKEGSRGEVDVDMIYWFRIFASTAIAVLMVTSISTVMSSLYNLGDYVITGVATSQVASLTGRDKVTMDQIADSKNSGVQVQNKIDFTGEKEEAKMIAILKNIPGFEYLGAVVEEDGAGETGQNYLPEQNMVKYLDMFMYVAYLPMLVALFLMYSAIFELKIRQILAPMAVATISFEGARGSGVRFLKKYLACFLKIAIYFLVAWIGYCLSMYFYKRIITNDNIDTANNKDKREGSADVGAPGVMDAIMMLLSNVVCAMAMMQTGGIADEVVGS